MDGWISNWVRDLTAPMHLGLNDGPFVPHIKSWEPSPVALLKFQMALKLRLLISSDSKEKEPT